MVFKTNKTTSVVFPGVLTVLGAVLVATGAVILIWFPLVVDYFVKQKVVIEEGNDVYTMWRQPPVPIYTRFYMFNITNPQEVEKERVKPILQEIGPFTYREQWLKVNITFHDNGTVSYRQRREIQFVPELSVANDTLEIVSVNVPMVTAASLFRFAGPLLKLALSAVFNMLHEQIFITKSVKQLLFEGYNDPLTKMAKEIMNTYPFDRFAYVMGRNGTQPGVFNVFTGKDDYTQFNSLDMFNGMKYVKWWGNTTCGMLNGTDGSGFPALRNREDPLSVYVADFCRTMVLDFEEEVRSTGGVPALRYVVTERLFGNASDYPENECFCSENQCLPSGLMNISKCKFDSPAVLSLPHFYLGAQELLDAVEGLNPNKSIHEFYAEIDPITGGPIKVDGKFQINIAIKRIPGLETFENLNSLFLPTLWFSQSAALTEDVVAFLTSQTRDPVVYSKIGSYILFTAGGLAILLGLYLLISRLKNRGKKNSMTIPPIENGSAPKA